MGVGPEVPLTTSPSSNIQNVAINTWGKPMEDYPFDALSRSGSAVTVKADNPLDERHDTREQAEAAR